MTLSVSDPSVSYLIGLLQADGSLYQNTRNRGRMSLELNIKDFDILLKLKEFIPVHTSIKERIRETNFSKISHTVTLSVFDLEFRTFLNSHGVPYGIKHNTIESPTGILAVDYFRGLIDGDGSIGYTKKGIPFISLCTASDSIAIFIKEFLLNTFGYNKKTSRNKRDNVYNIAVTRKIAVDLANMLYYDGCLFLNRKNFAAKNLKWEKPCHYKVRQKPFSKEEDLIILSNQTSIAAEKLNRTCKGVSMRKWRLKKQKIPRC